MSKTFMGHPRGLFNLFFTELWERFSYYGMRALLVLYMVDTVKNGGMGMSNEQSIAIYGNYTMCVYLASLPGGLIADRFIGARYAVLVGGIIIALGHFVLAIPQASFFYLGLVLIVIGTGLLKPNISTMVGALYPLGDVRRDAGFSIFYMGVNIGATTAPILCGYVAQDRSFKAFLESINIPAHLSWHLGFALAGFGMLIGLLHYTLQWRLLFDIGLPKRKQDKEKNEVEGSAKTRLISSEEWPRLGAIAILFCFNIVFLGCL